MSYLIGSGYHFKNGKDPDFPALWIANINRHADPKPSRIIVISTGGRGLPFVRDDLQEIVLEGDLGHFMDLVEGRKPHKFNGWTGPVLAAALLAYCDESDFVYLEEDCLAFGPWVKQLYSEIGNAGVLFGHKHQSEPWQPCSQSLFLVRHSYIPEFAKLILQTDSQAKPGELGEHKFERMQQQFPDQWKFMSFGVDRCRPIPFDAPVFYVQQLHPDEIQQLKERGLL